MTMLGEPESWAPPSAAQRLRSSSEAETSSVAALLPSAQATVPRSLWKVVEDALMIGVGGRVAHRLRCLAAASASASGPSGPDLPIPVWEA